MTDSRVGLDTNVLIYAEGIDDTARQKRALQVLFAIPRERFVISVQVIGELFNVLVSRRVSRETALGRALYWKQALAVIGTSHDLMDSALGLAAQHHVRIWDALILAAAAEARCDLLLSEDFQDGFAWRGVTVVNPFAAKPHKLLADLLRE